MERVTTPLLSESNNVLSGLFAEMDVFNQNGRKYPTDIYEQAYEELLPKIKDRKLLGELDHPIDYDEVRLSNVSHVITDCYIKESGGIKKVYGTVELLDTPAGKIAQALVKAGIPLGISSRGVGSTHQVRDGVEVSQLKLITYDLVAEPSFSNAILTPEKSKELSDSLHYIETHLPLNESKDSDHIRDQINQIRESLLHRETSSIEEVNINEDIKSLQNLLEESKRVVENDTVLLAESRKRIKSLEAALEEYEESYKSLNSNMEHLQEAYNELSESSMSPDERNLLVDTITDLQKRLCVEKRGMSYNSVSKLLEGATSIEEIEDRLDSLSSMRKNTQSTIVFESTQTESSEPSVKLSRLASIVSRI